MRIMVTNDDGIDSVGLHVLARAVAEHGDVTVIAPDSEYSGAGAAIGALWQAQHEVHEVSIDGIDRAYSVTGAPALCVMFARMGAFGDPPDLIVSGINPGANVGRSVYHSGTIGACLTGRNGGITGIAVSQSVPHFGVEGQAWEDVVADMPWDTAATVAADLVGAFVAAPPEAGSVLNVNVPGVPLEELTSYRWTEVGMSPPRAISTATLEPRPGHVGAYRVEMAWGDAEELAPETDTGAIMNGEVSLTWLSRILAEDRPRLDGIEQALGTRLTAS